MISHVDREIIDASKVTVTREISRGTIRGARGYRNYIGNTAM